jgi:hypothetical protein
MLMEVMRGVCACTSVNSVQINIGTSSRGKRLIFFMAGAPYKIEPKTAVEEAAASPMNTERTWQKAAGKRSLRRVARFAPR